MVTTVREEDPVADKKRGAFVVGLVGGAIVAWLLATKQGKRVRGRVFGSGDAASGGGDMPEWQGDGSGGDVDARSAALRQKIEETRRRLREQVGLPPEGQD
jgi:hypothetical protein